MAVARLRATLSHHVTLLEPGKTKEGDTIPMRDAPPGLRPVAAETSLAILPMFVVTSFLSAWLLFAIQPMSAKMVLPLLGGAPSVWITAMLFFQVTLLAGYAYVHATTRLLGLRRQVLVHLAVLAVALVSLPVQVAWTEPVISQPVLWLTAILTVSVGLPFFAVSATAPLLQRWFGHTGHSHAHDPYFLYGASNLGSILGLLSYPVLAEPLLRLDQQGWTWTGGYGVLVLLIAVCALTLRRVSAAPDMAPDRPALASEPVSWRRRAHWIALAFAPSSLLLGVTTHITTDVAAVPLLWVVPLTLYLLTFVFVFARRPVLRHQWMVASQPYVLVLTFVLLPFPFVGKQWVPSVAANLIVFFVTAMVCHGELARRRPAVSHLTEFYFAMALGGMLGGAFNALLAPVLFTGVYEYHLALVIACMLRPTQAAGGAKARLLVAVLPALLSPTQAAGGAKARLLDAVLPALLFALLILPGPLGLPWPWELGVLVYLAHRIVILVLIFGFKERPLRFGLGMAAFLMAHSLFGDTSNIVEQARSFFGVYKVTAHEKGAKAYILSHGTTIHGVQYADPATRREPLAYYTEPGPLGQLFAALGGLGRPRNIGVIGLGAGAAICYQRPGQHWTIYEIDPLVTRIAQDTRFFNYLADCMDDARMEIVHGDARLSLRGAEDRQFDLLILDAFSSNAVPVHLLTREAMALYFEKLSEDGIVMFHISNRHLNLVRVLSGLLDDAGLAGLSQRHRPDQKAGRWHFRSHWVAIGRTREALTFLSDDSRWTAIAATPASVLWTDDFSNIVGAFK